MYLRPSSRSFAYSRFFGKSRLCHSRSYIAPEGPHGALQLSDLPLRLRQYHEEAYLPSFWPLPLICSTAISVLISVLELKLSLLCSSSTHRLPRISAGLCDKLPSDLFPQFSMIVYAVLILSAILLLTTALHSVLCAGSAYSDPLPAHRHWAYATPNSSVCPSFLKTTNLGRPSGDASGQLMRAKAGLWRRGRHSWVCSGPSPPYTSCLEAS